MDYSRHALRDGGNTLCGIDTTGKKYARHKYPYTELFRSSMGKIRWTHGEPTCDSCVLLMMAVPEKHYTCQCAGCQIDDDEDYG